MVFLLQIEVDDSTLTPDSDTVNRAFAKSKVTYTLNGTDVVFEPNKPFSVTDRELTAEMLSTEIKRKATVVIPQFETNKTFSLKKLRVISYQTLFVTTGLYTKLSNTNWSIFRSTKIIDVN